MPVVTMPKMPDVTIPKLPDVTIPKMPAVTIPKMPAVTMPKMPAVTMPKMPAATIPKMPAVTIPKMPNVHSGSGSGLVGKIFRDIPLQLTTRLLDGIEGIMGIDPTLSSYEIKRRLQAKTRILSSIAQDPVIVKDITTTMRETSDILVQTVKETGPKLTSAGSNVLQAIPLYGNIISIVRAAAEGSDAAAKLAGQLVEAGILTMKTVDRIKMGARRLNQLSQAGDAIGNSARQSLNRGIHSAATIASGAIQSGLNKVDHSVMLPQPGARSESESESGHMNAPLPSPPYTENEIDQDQPHTSSTQKYKEIDQHGGKGTRTHADMHVLTRAQIKKRITMFLHP